MCGFGLILIPVAARRQQVSVCKLIVRNCPNLVRRLGDVNHHTGIDDARSAVAVVMLQQLAAEPHAGDLWMCHTILIVYAKRNNM